MTRPPAPRGARSRLRRLCLRSPQLFVALWAPDDRELGELGEEVAARHLIARGWTILARRLRTRAGEADLVARLASSASSAGVLAVVEVKTGRLAPFPRPAARSLSPSVGLRWRPGYRCDTRRLARLAEVARGIGALPCFSLGGSSRGRSSLGPIPGRERVRIDLIEVFLEEPRRRFRVLHHEDLRTPLA